MDVPFVDKNYFCFFKEWDESQKQKQKLWDVSHFQRTSKMHIMFYSVRLETSDWSHKFDRKEFTEVWAKVCPISSSPVYFDI